MRCTLLVLALVLCSSPPCLAQLAPSATVPYATVGGRELLLDLFLPATGTAPRPVVVWLHDGGWLTGSRALPDFVAPLVARGIAVASIDYRLTSEGGRYGGEGVTFPAQLH